MALSISSSAIPLRRVLIGAAGLTVKAEADDAISVARRQEYLRFMFDLIFDLVDR
jgi:hypothetical protein